MINRLVCSDVTCAGATYKTARHARKAERHKYAESLEAYADQETVTQTSFPRGSIQKNGGERRHPMGANR